MSRSRNPDGRKDLKLHLHFNPPSSPVSPLIVNPRSSSSSSSSDSVSGRNGEPPFRKRSDDNSHSGEISVCSEKLDHRRRSIFVSGSGCGSGSGFSGGGRGSDRGGSTASSGGGGSRPGSPIVNVLPTGNIVPSGMIHKSNTHLSPPRNRNVLNSGNRNYGIGSVVRSSSSSSGGGDSGGGVKNAVEEALGSGDLEFVKSTGNDQYRSKNFKVALSLYNRAVKISPMNAVCRCNRAAALMGLGRLAEAVRDCEEAVKLDPSYQRARQRLASLYLGLAQIENARTHLCYPGQQPDLAELQKLQQIEKHLKGCSEARSIGNWHTVLKEVEAAIAAGADSSPQLLACRAEALLKLHRFTEAQSALSRIPKFEPSPPSCSQTKFFGMLPESYVFYVQAQVELALGRFENAVIEAEKAWRVDPLNYEIAKMWSNAPLVKREYERGNDLFNDKRFMEAASAYGEGLKLDPSNSVLYYNRAVCWFKLGRFENSVRDCTTALEIQPSYTQALYQRAQCYEKLGLWTDSLRDYELLKKENRRNNEVVEAILRVQTAMKNSCERAVQFHSVVEDVSDLDRFRAATSTSGTTLVYFKAAANRECEQVSPVIDMLATRYPSASFLKVDVKESFVIAKVENVMVVPTVRIYKKGRSIEEMIRPSQQMLEASLKQRGCSPKSYGMQMLAQG